MSRSFQRSARSSGEVPIEHLRQQIAMRAGRLIAEEGLDYASAKRRAVQDILGTARVAGECLPDNEEVEAEVRAYQGLFQSESQPRRLRELRELAVELMKWLDAFRPHLIGAVLNGTASEHSAIHLELYTDSAKDVEIFLLNHGIDFDVVELDNVQRPNRPLESIRFEWKPHRQRASEGVELIVHETGELRGLVHRERADRGAVEELIAEGEDRP